MDLYGSFSSSFMHKLFTAALENFFFLAHLIGMNLFFFFCCCGHQVGTNADCIFVFVIFLPFHPVLLLPFVLVGDVCD